MMKRCRDTEMQAERPVAKRLCLSSVTSKRKILLGKRSRVDLVSEQDICSKRPRQSLTIDTDMLEVRDSKHNSLAGIPNTVEFIPLTVEDNINQLTLAGIPNT